MKLIDKSLDTAPLDGEVLPPEQPDEWGQNHFTQTNIQNNYYPVEQQPVPKRSWLVDFLLGFFGTVMFFRMLGL